MFLNNCQWSLQLIKEPFSDTLFDCDLVWTDREVIIMIILIVSDGGVYLGVSVQLISKRRGAGSFESLILPVGAT